MPGDFLIARNPEPDSRLPYLLRVPLGRDGLVLKARDTWPRTSAVYCHQLDVAWPADVELVEQVPVRSCVRRGAAIDLVLDRTRENRSQLVFTTARGRPVIFWQTARVAKQSRPGVRRPAARAAGLPDLPVIIDSHERYPWTFSGKPVQTSRRALPAGDYATTRDGQLIAAVERKSLADLVTSITTGKLGYQLADLATIPRAAVAVEDRYAAIFKLDRVRPAVVADALAEHAVRWPSVPIVFCDTRALAEEWAYRFLAAAWAHTEDDQHAAVVAGLPVDLTGPAAPDPTTAEVRAWARAAGLTVPDRGRLRPDILAAYRDAHPAHP